MNHILIDAMGTVKARPFPTRESAERMARQMNTLDATYYALYYGSPRFSVITLDEVCA